VPRAEVRHHSCDELAAMRRQWMMCMPPVDVVLVDLRGDGLARQSSSRGMGQRSAHRYKRRSLPVSPPGDTRWRDPEKASHETGTGLRLCSDRRPDPRGTRHPPRPLHFASRRSTERIGGGLPAANHRWHARTAAAAHTPCPLRRRRHTQPPLADPTRAPRRSHPHCLSGHGGTSSHSGGRSSRRRLMERHHHSPARRRVAARTDPWTIQTFSDL